MSRGCWISDAQIDVACIVRVISMHSHFMTCPPASSSYPQKLDIERKVLRDSNLKTTRVWRSNGKRKRGGGSVEKILGGAEQEVRGKW